MNTIKSLNQTIVLFIILLGLLGYNFMSAQWTPPTATAPDNNTEAPINVGTVYQAKIGDLGAVKMRAGEYCNADGTICTSVSSSTGGFFAENAMYSATNTITNLTPGKKYLVFFMGWDSNSSGGTITDCVGNILVKSSARATTDRNISGSHLLPVIAPASGCIKTFTRGIYPSPALYTTVI